MGFAFKKNTNDVRESPAISVCKDLLIEGADVIIYDPQVTAKSVAEAISVFSKTLPNDWSERIQMAQDPYEAAKDAHAIVILTEWDVFKSLDFHKLYAQMLKPAFIFDGRNLLDLKMLEAIGFKVFGIGKG